MTDDTKCLCWWPFARAVLGIVLIALTGSTISATAQSRSVDLRQVRDVDVLTIDGAIEPLWDSATLSPIDRTVDGTPAPDDADDLQGQWRAAWDDTNLYLLIEVTDDVVNDDNESGDAFGVSDDSPEVYLDLDNSGNTASENGPANCFYDDNDVQLIFEDGITYLGYCNEGGANSGDDVPGVTFAEVSTDDGYRVEVSIPWTSVASLTPVAGDVIGIDVHINDDDDGSGRDHKLTWNDDGTEEAFREPDAFGSATLTGTPLPVELASFQARMDGDAVALRWSTTSETNNARFDVQRRAGEAPWTTIGSVEGAGTTTRSRTYRLNDRALPFEATTLSYRLRQVDVDGTANLSKAVTVDRETAQRLTVTAPAPNPADAYTQVGIAMPEGHSEARITVHDVLGREVQQQTLRPSVRANARISVDGLASGVYFVRVVAGDQSQTQKLIVVR